MKDTERMDKEEKRRYIFVDTSFEGRSRFKWITDCLLGDIRTFLDGIEYFIIQKKGEFGGQRGGGNLSVPILINTALEFVAELYTGKTDYMKFNTDIKFKKDLEDDKKVSEDLKREFTIRNFPLPKKTEITEIKADEEWEIKDDETKKLYYVVDIKYDKGKEKELVFHFLDRAKYEATENTKKFIMRYFPEKYKEIPLFLWDGIRNGLVHTFSPKPFEYNGSSIRFQFYVEDQNFPSHIEKVKGYLSSVEDGSLLAELNKEGKVSEEKLGVPVPENSTVRREKKYLFSMDIVLENELNDRNRNISKGLEDVFRIKRFELGEKATKTKENDYKWEITDKKDIYIVKREEGKLNVYKKEEKKWEMTNGVDTLYALEQEDEEKINIYNYIIQLRINVFELFRVLEKAVEAYRAELENSSVLQDKFIRAWSSIEEYQRDITKDKEKSKEAKVLIDYLGSDSSKFLLKSLNDKLSVDVLKIYSLNSLMIRRS